MIKLELPISIKLSKAENGKKYHLTLNNYRNWHYRISNILKIKFKEQIQHKLKNLKSVRSPLHLSYRYYAKDKRPRDVDNCCAIIHKFFADAMTDLQVIEDDSYKHVPSCDYKYVGVDKDNPRCEVIISDPASDLSTSSESQVLLPSGYFQTKFDFVNLGSL